MAENQVLRITPARVGTEIFDAMMIDLRLRLIDFDLGILCVAAVRVCVRVRVQCLLHSACWCIRRVHSLPSKRHR